MERLKKEVINAAEKVGKVADAVILPLADAVGRAADSVERTARKALNLEDNDARQERIIQEGIKGAVSAPMTYEEIMKTAIGDEGSVENIQERERIVQGIIRRFREDQAIVAEGEPKYGESQAEKEAYDRWYGANYGLKIKPSDYGRRAEGDNSTIESDSMYRILTKEDWQRVCKELNIQFTDG